MISEPDKRVQEDAMKPCDNVARNKVACTCTYVSCERHGACCACVTYHRQIGELPGCFFPPAAEKTYDRSARHYVRVAQDRE
jgi:hypothetical protein